MSKKSEYHGKDRVRLYSSWINMMCGCYDQDNSSYPFLGGMGVIVCDKWRASPEAFAADMGPMPANKPRLGRKDIDGIFEPGNVRWATSNECRNNTRANVFLEYDGERLTIAQWAKRLNMHYDALRARLRRDWSMQRIVETPVRPLRKKPVN